MASSKIRMRECAGPWNMCALPKRNVGILAHFPGRSLMVVQQQVF